MAHLAITIHCAAGEARISLRSRAQPSIAGKSSQSKLIMNTVTSQAGAGGGSWEGLRLRGWGCMLRPAVRLSIVVMQICRLCERPHERSLSYRR